ncbi:MAG TPA: alpha-amylase family glycosyl hydrolase, partial [Nitrospiraceae bacterium]
MPISDLSSGWTVESTVSASAWRMSLGAQSTGTGVQFRVWAPKCQQVDVVLESTGESARLAKNPQGYFSGFVPGVEARIPYRYRLDDGRSYPDPCSRYQPQGPHGASVIVDPSTYAWHDQNWRGVRMRGQVFYELHIGTFTPEGTYVAAITKLDELVRLGVTVLELMPLAEFPGRWNWGYDGVSLFAPSHRYGHPDELKRLVDEAHSRGLGVILDVVYNHFGPDGN